MLQRDRESPADRLEPELQGWTLAEDSESDDEPEYKKQLYSLFSPSLADSFLQPLHTKPMMNPNIQLLQESVRGHVTADNLWHTIREGSRRQWSLACSQHLQDLAKQAAAEAGQRAWSGLGRLRTMVEMQQGQANAMLSANPLDDLNDRTGREGPRRFLPSDFVPTLTEAHTMATKELNREQKCEPQQQPTPAPHGLTWDGKPCRFLMDEDVSAIEHSAWWRHLNEEKLLEPPLAMTTQFSLKDAFPRNSEQLWPSVYVCLIKEH
ncbi:uncharacterized protein LOC122543818 [Chiloscyllium plagiosum]|uniref:uncharacterized protein LOC122543818 n=1 Tax=Chiloscyllium plagiosum TaxID=36176 RepID=UPI001CB86487|nr:uncharacterized protein LOC122543818 [Chiloscyllium plagiosum]